MTTSLVHRFVDYIPDKLDPGTIYVSIEHAVVAHNCCCGCGLEVVTPLAPTDWKLTFDGDTVSLDPSIGNWSFPCRSHYWITNSKVHWAPRWTTDRIDRARQLDISLKAHYFNEPRDEAAAVGAETASHPDEGHPRPSHFQRAIRLLRRRKVADPQIDPHLPHEPPERR